MATITFDHTCGIDEIAAEMDRRGEVIEALEAKLEARLAGHRLSAKQSTALLIAGKHLAVKLAEVYRATGASPANCQAIRDWMAAASPTLRADEEGR